VGSTEINFIIDLALALVCGLLIGGERELKRKPAGISTQTLVISGAMLFTFLSQAVGSGDRTRIAAQIVSGIGFLGAGIIIKSEAGKQVINVTTAASIWYSAAIGMALGFDFHFVALAAALYAVLISRLPHLNRKSDE
jgi:putative Mg2+ transporter-C (MgtC) family protein